MHRFMPLSASVCVYASIFLSKMKGKIFIMKGLMILPRGPFHRIQLKVRVYKLKVLRIFILYFLHHRSRKFVQGIEIVDSRV